MSAPGSPDAGAPRPTVVRGVTMVGDAQGELHPVRRPVVALCACARSASLPWCDSTHKALGARRDRVGDDTSA